MSSIYLYYIVDTILTFTAYSRINKVYLTAYSLNQLLTTYEIFNNLYKTV